MYLYYKQHDGEHIAQVRTTCHGKTLQMLQYYRPIARLPCGSLYNDRIIEKRRVCTKMHIFCGFVLVESISLCEKVVKNLSATAVIIIITMTSCLF